MGGSTDFSTCPSGQVLEKFRLSARKSTCTRASQQASRHCLWCNRQTHSPTKVYQGYTLAHVNDKQTVPWV